MSTWNETKFVLDRQPDNSRALAYQALVRLAMGDNAAAEAMLKQALAKDPNLLDGWIHLSLVYFEAGRTSDALAALKEARTRHPEEAAALQQLEQEILRSPTQPSAPAAGAPAPAAAAASGPVIRAEVSLAPGTAGSVRLPALMFVTVRSAGVAAGPPAAAKRMQVSSFPVRLELSAADSMMGTPLPDVARVEVRIDMDGDAMTREPNAPTAVADQVKAGSDLNLQLAVR
jgi:cytochrome c-type biogenesis protein CcmH